ncbi:MAG TPA: ABC transporter substrate-binding protein [Jiangellaceae bacterium]|jgi:osmoprotectant transport system substrate-binding protein|nr:ABC transporter substrate-binding protein [Jiangellaceae bacterium]
MKDGRRLPAMVAGLGLLLALGACGGDDDDPLETGSDGETTAASGGELTVGGADFTEMRIMQEMYRLLLEDAGYTVDIQRAEARELYGPALESGEIDVVPEYAATMAEYLNARKNGPDAPVSAPIATSDAAETVAAMAPIAEEYGLTILEPAEAADQNGFAVSQEFADANGGLTTLTQLGELGLPIVLAAGEECAERPFCQPGLEETYGLQITEILPLGFSTPQVKEAVAGGEAQLGLVATTDGTLESFGLVLLEDDKSLQLADNLVPIVNTETAGDEAVAEALNALAGVLTTEDLATLNAQVDAERQQEADVAQAYLEDKGLIGG